MGLSQQVCPVITKFNGKPISLPPPNRHCHVIWHIADNLGGKKPITGEQGFVDDKGNFLNREDALEMAINNNQILNPDDIRGGMLYSEDLW